MEPILKVPAIQLRNPNANNSENYFVDFSRVEELKTAAEKQDYLKKMNTIFQQFKQFQLEENLNTLKELSRRVKTELMKSSGTAAQPRESGWFNSYFGSVFPSISSISDASEYEAEKNKDSLDSKLSQICDEIEKTMISDEESPELFASMVAGVSSTPEVIKSDKGHEQDANQISDKVANKTIADKGLGNRITNEEKKSESLSKKLSLEKSTQSESKKNLLPERQELELVEEKIKNINQLLKEVEQILSKEERLQKNVSRIVENTEEYRKNEDIQINKVLNPFQEQIRLLKEIKSSLIQWKKLLILPLIAPQFPNKMPERGTEAREIFELDLIRFNFPEDTIDELAEKLEYQTSGDNPLNREQYVKAVIHAKELIFKELPNPPHSERPSLDKIDILGLDRGTGSWIKALSLIDENVTSKFINDKKEMKEGFYPLGRYIILNLLGTIDIQTLTRLLLKRVVEEDEFFQEIYQEALARKDKELLLALELIGISYESMKEQRNKFILEDKKFIKIQQDGAEQFSTWLENPKENKDKLLHHLLTWSKWEKQAVIVKNDLLINQAIKTKWDQFKKW